MTIWHDCTMTTLYHSADSSEDTACTVRIDDEDILVEYDDGGLVQYRGRGDGKGHYELEGVGFAGRATLHRFPGSVILEGNWLEEGYRGMWYIRSNETGQ